MPRLPVVSGDEFVKAMGKTGFTFDHSKGSHMIPVNLHKQRLSVLKHKQLGPGLLISLIHDAGLTKDKFIDLLKD